MNITHVRAAARNRYPTIFLMQTKYITYINIYKVHLTRSRSAFHFVKRREIIAHYRYIFPIVPILKI